MAIFSHTPRRCHETVVTVPMGTRVNPRFRLRQPVVVYLDDFLGARVRYDTTKAQAHLRRLGVAFPNVRDGLVARYLNHGIDAGFLLAPTLPARSADNFERA